MAFSSKTSMYQRVWSMLPLSLSYCLHSTVLDVSYVAPVRCVPYDELTAFEAESLCWISHADAAWYNTATGACVWMTLLMIEHSMCRYSTSTGGDSALVLLLACDSSRYNLSIEIVGHVSYLTFLGLVRNCERHWIKVDWGALLCTTGCNVVRVSWAPDPALTAAGIPRSWRQRTPPAACMWLIQNELSVDSCQCKVGRPLPRDLHDHVNA